MMNNPRIIHAPMNNRRYGITAPITQYDYGYLLLPEGVELPTTYEIDFSNDEHKGTSLTVYGGSDGAEVPEELIRTGKDVFAFYYKVGDGYGKTDYTWRIPNHCRPSRDGETPTPSQQSSIDQLIVRSNEAVESAEQSASDASTSAQNASADAERAEEARTDAQNYATQAEQSATDAHESASQASASATASAQSASQSAQIKADVEDLADDAQGYAQASERSASASANSASQAQGFANNASSSAQSASQSASGASASAQTASAKAQDASTSAQTASQKATESAQSASQALTYKTDAESAKTASQTAQGLAESARDSAVSAKNDAESARDDAESARDEAQQAVASISGALDDKADIITDTASGAVASFSDGADGLPLKSLVVDINPVQDLHGYDSPWPAGGGKNKIEIPTFINGYCTWSSVPQNGTDLLSEINKLPVGDYVILGEFELTERNDTSDSSRFGIAFFYGGTLSQYIGDNSIRWGNIGVGGVKTFETTASITSEMAGTFTAVRVYGCGMSGVGTTGKAKINKLQVEEGSAATSYAPYENICPISGWTQVNVNHSDADMTNPTTITIDLGQTVYGAKLYPLEGKAVIDRAMVDLGTLNWAYNTTYAFFTTPSLIDRKIGVTNMVSDLFKTEAGSWSGTPKTNAIWGDGSNATVYVQYPLTAVEDFLALVTGHQLVYELAEPITIQLTPNQVNSLLGVNNIWADSGDTEVEYRADTKLYIERLTAPDSADMIADANIVSGQYFIVGNSLYKASANIANGGQITVGTNCTRVSLAQALNEINA